jgi:integrase/recombinase XerD
MLMHAVETYLAVRRATGFALDHTEGYLRHFARFAMARGQTHIVAGTAVDWASLATAEAQRHHRLQTVLRFAHFMAAEDPCHEIPPAGLFSGRRQRPLPYLFSDEEIQQLMGAASRLGPPGSLRPHTYSTLFGLLAVTGMRVAEARNLHLRDVAPDGLVIRESLSPTDFVVGQAFVQTVGRFHL